MSDVHELLKKIPVEHLSRTVAVFGRTPLLRQLHDMCLGAAFVHPWGLLGALLVRTSLIYPEASCAGEPLNLFAAICGYSGSGKHTTRDAADEVVFGNVDDRNTSISANGAAGSEQGVAAAIRHRGFCCNLIYDVGNNARGATQALGRAWAGEDIALKKGKTPEYLSGRVAVVAHAYPGVGAKATAGELLDKFTWWRAQYPMIGLLLEGGEPRYLDFSEIRQIRDVNRHRYFGDVVLPLLDRDIGELDVDPLIPPPETIRDRNRIRIAGLGALLHGESAVNFGWWLWADECLRHSDDTADVLMGYRPAKRASA